MKDWRRSTDSFLQRAESDIMATVAIPPPCAFHARPLLWSQVAAPPTSSAGRTRKEQNVKNRT